MFKVSDIPKDNQLRDIIDNVPYAQPLFILINARSFHWRRNQSKTRLVLKNRTVKSMPENESLSGFETIPQN